MIVNMPQLPGIAGWIAGHRKVLIAAGGSLVTIIVQVWGTSNPWIALAVLAATSLGVYRAPNTPPATAQGRSAAAPAPAAPALPAAGSGGAAGAAGPPPGGA